MSVIALPGRLELHYVTLASHAGTLQLAIRDNRLAIPSVDIMAEPQQKLNRKQKRGNEKVTDGEYWTFKWLVRTKRGLRMEDRSQPGVVDTGQVNHDLYICWAV